MVIIGEETGQLGTHKCLIGETILMMSFIIANYILRTLQKLMPMTSTVHGKKFSSHTMSVAPESGWKLQAVTLQGGLIGIQLGMSPRWNFTNSSDTE